MTADVRARPNVRVRSCCGHLFSVPFSRHVAMRESRSSVTFFLRNRETRKDSRALFIRMRSSAWCHNVGYPLISPAGVLYHSPRATFRQSSPPLPMNGAIGKAKYQSRLVRYRPPNPVELRLAACCAPLLTLFLCFLSLTQIRFESMCPSTNTSTIKGLDRILNR